MSPARRQPAYVTALLLCASLFCLGARAASQPPASQAPSDLGAQIDAIVAAAATTSPMAGLTIGVERMGRTIAMRAYGEADRENHAKTTEQTIYGVGSISKMFAAAMIFRLIERGRLSLDDDVTRFVPDFPEPNGAISIEHLLHHTSGIPDFEYVGEWPHSMALPRTKPQVVATFRDLPRLFAPGTRWAYSSSGYYLLGLVIETIAGRPWEDVLRDEIFAPSGLAATTFCDPFSIIEHRARGYGFGDDRVMRHAAPVVLTQYGLSGAICSSAPDLLRFWRALEEGRIVSAASFTKMTVARPLPDGTATSYGYGIIPGAYKGHRMLSHSGHVPGYTAQLARYPDDELTIVVLTNTDSVAPLRIESQIADLLLARR